MIEMRVAGVILDSQSKHPIVMLRDLGESRALLIWIGEPEANAILMVLESIQAPRPMTHDLLSSVFDALEAKLERIAITEMRDRTFYAVLELNQGGKTFSIDARPSDAIALALRAEAPIYVSEEVMEANAIPINPSEEPADDEEFRRFLENVKPGDFGRFNKD